MLVPRQARLIENYILSDPKAILEHELTHYSVLHKGDTIAIQYGGREYLIDVMDTKPDD